MPESLVRTDLDLPLDVLRHLASQITLDLVVLVDEGADLQDLVFGEIPHLGPARHTRAVHDLERPCGADAVDVAERDIQSLVSREVDASDACHVTLGPFLSPAAACAGDSSRSPGSGRVGVSPGSGRRSS